MDHKGESQDGTEELPPMDGSCDACEPDEAQPATQVCYTCSFAFCSVHADRHTSRTNHRLMLYNHDVTQPSLLGTERELRGADNEAGAATNDLPVADAYPGDDFGKRKGLQNVLQLDTEQGDGAGATQAEQETMASKDTRKRDTVTVERLRCKGHGQEGSLYCKTDEKIICVVCAVQGEHRKHEIITLHEAYLWQKNKQGYDLLGCTQEMAEKIKTKWTNPEMSTDELEAYVNDQFDELCTLVHLEEKRTLHLVDLKEAFLTASAAEKIVEIGLETTRLQEEMANITNQLCLLEQAGAGGAAVVAESLIAGPRPDLRLRAGGSHGQNFHAVGLFAHSSCSSERK
ncbi:tripartite motif-containing protein 44 isoform X2 [Antennarius striatus]|uniref:tripartite motif-containing protein 44 isoform X2 n=1 Tax=Antennarius striatus TaxID=241820 RepID=UPI0035B38B51